VARDFDRIQAKLNKLVPGSLYASLVERIGKRLDKRARATMEAMEAGKDVA